MYLFSILELGVNWQKQEAKEDMCLRNVLCHHPEVMRQRRSGSFSRASHIYIHDFQLVVPPSLSNALLFMSHTLEIGPKRVLETSADHIANNNEN